MSHAKTRAGLISNARFSADTVCLVAVTLSPSSMTADADARASDRIERVLRLHVELLHTLTDSAPLPDRSARSRAPAWVLQPDRG